MKRKTWNRTVSLILALVMTLALTACAGSSTAPAAPAAPADSAAPAAPAASAAAPTASNPVTLTVWAPRTFAVEADEMLAARCAAFAESRDDVKEVKIEYVPSTDATSLQYAAIESKTGPDLTFLHMAAYNTFMDMDVLLDITDVVAEIEKGNGPMIANRKSSIEIDGVIATIPLYSQISMMHYRTDLLSAAGFTGFPKTWHELRQVAEAVSKPEDGVYGVGFAVSHGANGEDTLLQLMRTFGSYYWDEAGNVTANSPETVEAIKFVAALYNDKLMPPSVVEWDTAPNKTSYLAGESAITFNGANLMQMTLEDDYKDTLGANTALAPHPGGEYEAWYNQPFITFSAFNFTPNPELSKELLKFLFAPEWYDDFMEFSYPIAMPVFTKSAEHPNYDTELGKELLNQSNTGYPFAWPCTDVKVKIADSLAYSDLLTSKTVQRVVLGSMTAEEAAAEIEAKLKGYLASVK